MVDHTCWLEPGKDKFFNEFFEGNTILQPNRNRNGETIQHTPHGSAFLGHIYKNLSKRAIRIFTCPEKNNLTVNFRFLSKSTSFCRQGSAFNNGGKFSF